MEQRLKASQERALDQHDEIEHIALYNQINLYHELPVKGMDSMTYGSSYMRDIDLYFSEKHSGKSPELPARKIPPKVADLLRTIKESRFPGRFEVASIILSMDEIVQLDDALKYVNEGQDKGKQRSMRLPFSSVSYGLTVSNMTDKNWNEELIYSAAQMKQSRCTRWLAVQLDSLPPYAVMQIRLILPGQFSENALLRGHEHLEMRVRETIEGNSIGRNDPCPCGSGKKYKKCHGCQGGRNVVC